MHASELGELETGSIEDGEGSALVCQDSPEMALTAVLPRRSSGASSLAYANQARGGSSGFTRIDNSCLSANKAVANLWQNKRDMVDPRSLNTIQEIKNKEPRSSHILAFSSSNNS